ncbi:MAG: hypothetical protein M1821_004666 [Bathelium mastoideum]|nr:MAG: hypothetical protein M1821_004666 [Bathelium mastoideum]
MVPLPDEQSPIDDEPFESSTDYDSHFSGGSDERLQWGYFALSLEESRGPEFPQLGWRFGRGSARLPNRGVDMLLARPRESASRSLASQHFRLRISEHSGLLMLCCGAPKRPPLETNVGGKWELLEPGQETLVYQKSTLLRVGRCELELQYTISKDNQAVFLARRNAFIDRNLHPPSNVYESSTYIPGGDITVRGRYLQLATRGHGTFGWVSQGFDTHTGQLIAIKELRIRKNEDWLDVQNEIKLGKRSQMEDGLLSFHDSYCEHGKIHVCSIPEKYYLNLPYAISDLSTDFWANANRTNVQKLSLLEQPLRGLITLYKMGIMHRDIKPENILLLSEKPPQAAICDFGKAIKAEFSKATYIGPVHTLAPEIWIQQESGYTRQIDVWAFGYAIATILGYRPKPPSQISPGRHDMILKKLKAHAQVVSEDEYIVDLAMRMFAWNPDERPTAAEALEHACWAPIRTLDSGSRIVP